MCNALTLTAPLKQEIAVAPNLPSASHKTARKFGAAGVAVTVYLTPNLNPNPLIAAAGRGRLAVMEALRDPASLEGQWVCEGLGVK